MPDTTNPIGFTDANELREKNRATVEKYMNTKGQDRLRRHELFVEDGCVDACRSLGVVDSALRRWVKQLQQERDGVTPKSKALTPEQQKIQELEARINRLEREKAILKKATALLMSDELDRTR